eukprot:SAG25_NODE_178_length_12673_cov_19.868459_7_plen_1726_part_01
MWKEDHQVVVSDFLTTTVAVELKRLYVFMATSGELTIQYTVPKDKPSEMMYFLRDSSKEITKETVEKEIQYGTVSGESMDSLLRLMVSVYVPLYTNNTSWPVSVRKEFSGYLQKFMANLTETAHELQGSTILYVPTESIDLDQAPNEKDQVQRLESTVIHWTRQIQEVVNNQESGADQSDDAGPLEEIRFWRSRTLDLSGIREQLELPGVLLIVSVLEATNSTYLLAFTKLADEIKEKTQTAEDNCRFLQLLQEPCEQLAAAEPKDIPVLLPHLLNCIRMIWSTSTFFRIPERLTRLLRKVSNELIHRCRAKISLEEIFEGDAKKAIKALNESVECIEQWRKCYDKTVEMVERKGSTWVSTNSESGVDANNVFAHVFAFKQRCSDLLEVCEGRLQFAPQYGSSDGIETSRPVFRGPRGTEIQKSLEDIEASFAKDLEKLRKLKYDILDVKATGWHDDHTAFKNALRQLEAMTENAIQSACAADSLPNVSAGVELLEAFQMLAHRDKIKMKVDTMTAEVYQMFVQDMAAVKKEFDTCRQNPPLHHGFPKYAGAAMWAKSLKERITRQMDVLNAAHYLNPGSEAQDARDTYTLLSGALQEFRERMHKNWSSQLGIDLSKRLETKLLAKRPDTGLLVVNFDPHLLRFYSEIGYWEKQHFEIPYSKDVTDLAQNAGKIRHLRENVGLVVRDYNLIISSLSKKEQKLFQERIFHLDRKIGHGLTKFTWAQRIPMIMNYVKECRKYCREVYSTVTTFKTNNEQITKNCRKMAGELLVKIERKRVYEDRSFEQEQAEHRKHVQGILERSHQEIVEVLKKSQEIFSHDSPEVQAEWRAYCTSIDKDIEDALRMMVKKSLQEISRAINGESKTEVSPLFKMNVMLDDNRVSLQPSDDQLRQMVNTVAKDLITVIKIVPRVTELIIDQTASAAASESGAEQLASFHDKIRNDPEILEKTMVAIMEGMNGNIDRTTKYATQWDKYKTIWERNKDKVIKNYASQNHDVAAFETDIVYYRKLSEEVKSEDTHKSIAFVKLDCSVLKQQLAEHCIEWELRYTTLLNDTARAELERLHEMFATNTAILADEPRDLDHLAEQVNLQQGLTNDCPDIEAGFTPLLEQYKALEQFEVTYTETEGELLDTLDEKWTAFQHMLVDSATRLDKSKTNFRVMLNSNLDDFTERVLGSRAEFKKRGPFKADDLSIEGATELIAEFRQVCAKERETELNMKPGMDVFAMVLPEEIDPTISQTETDLNLLERVWDLMREWSGMWDGWKYGKFSEIDSEDMETQATAFNRRIVKIGKEGDAKKWGVWNTIKATVDQFKLSLPMITDLKNPALRTRHWDQLIEKVGQNFDPHSDDFTLERVFDLKLPNYVDDVSTISSNANKELAVEKNLEEITEAWERDPKTELIVQPYKDRGHHRFAAGEELFQQLEDNQVGISTMKASRFSLAFRDKLNYWEKALSLVSEVIEQGMNVQRQWMYLENIFIGSEDIKRQLPAEAAMFEKVNSNWKFIMDRMVKEVNAVKASHEDGLLDMLNEMDATLTKIQKSLDEYLEKKRMRFPRFYFISADDLLEILGQARNPEAVQPHFKKMFEGIKKLEFLAPQGSRKFYEATDFYAADKETVQFKDVLTIEGQVEDWLNKVESGMIASIHNLLQQTFVESRKKSTKKDKWAKAWPGQLLITSNQMGWTLNVEKALADVEGGNKSAMRQCRKSQLLLEHRAVQLHEGDTFVSVLAL